MLALFVLGGCATTPGSSGGVAHRVVPAAIAVEPVQAAPAAEMAASVADKQEPTLIPGNDRVVKLPTTKAISFAKGGAVSLKFEQAPVTDVVHAILGDLLKLPYTIHQPVGGEVTAYTQAPVPPAEAITILESVLGANGLALVQDAQGLFHVGRPEAVRGIGNSPRNIKAISPGQSMVIVPLQYVSAAEMADILRPVAPAEAFVRVDTVRNLLILSGSRNQLDGWLDFVDIFDVDMLKGMSVGLFPLKHASLREVAGTLAAISGQAAGGGADAGRASTQGGGEAATAPPGSTSSSAPIAALPNFGPIGGVLRVIPLERLNALLVITPRAYYLQQAREWIEKLDRPIQAGDAPQLYIYPVQNGTAKHLANLLSAVFGGTQQAGTRSQEDSGIAPGLSGAIGSSGDLSTSTGTSSSIRRPGSGLRGDSVSQLTLGGNVRVVADEKNNALLLYAPASEYEKIKGALRELDIAPTQVLIEASIIEVTLTDDLKYGLQWYFNDSLGSQWTGQGQLTSGSTSRLGPTNPGFSYSVVNSAGEVRAVLNALAEKSLVNVISSPSLLVQDNHTATIQVGDQQPIRSATTITDGGTTTNSIQYKDTGVNLEVTPSVNAGGMVSMDVDQEVTDVGPVDTATNQRSFLRRHVVSRVAVPSGETVVIGGLIRNNVSRGRQGVPLLMDIPVLGSLFSTTTNGGNRTELLIVITPRVVRNEAELRDVTDEMRGRIAESMRAMGGTLSLPGMPDENSAEALPLEPRDRIVTDPLEY